jgi:hypothetical protein
VVADSAGTVSTGTLATRTFTGTVSTNNACMFTLVLQPATTVTTLAVTSTPGHFAKVLLDAFIAGGGAAGVPTFVLMDTGFVYDKDAQTFWSDVSAHELPTAAGYTAGGIALGSPSTAYASGTHRSDLTSPNVTWTGSGAGFNTNGAILKLNTGTVGTSPIAAWFDFGGTVSVSATSQLILAPDSVLGWLFAGLLSVT